MTERRRARPKVSADRDERLLQAARSLFARDGFDATSVAHIADAAEVAVGTVYLRYRTKTDLLAAVLNRVADNFIAVMSQPSIHTLAWRERPRAMFAHLIAEAARQPDLPILMALSRYLPTASNEHPIRAWIEQFLREGQDAGAFREAPPAIAAYIAFGMVEGAMSCAFQTPAAREQIITTLADAAERWMLATTDGY